MSHVYLVQYRSHKSHSEDASKYVGIFTTRTLALEAARGVLGHEEDESYIREFRLNSPDFGRTIWDSHCDRKGEEYRSLYRQYWPMGMPMPQE